MILVLCVCVCVCVCVYLVLSWVFHSTASPSTRGSLVLHILPLDWLMDKEFSQFCLSKYIFIWCPSLRTIFNFTFRS